MLSSTIVNISPVFPSADSPVLTSRVAVTVHVLDINEFPPELSSPYETFVCENAKVGQVRSRRALVMYNASHLLLLGRVDPQVTRQLLIGVLFAVS